MTDDLINKAFDIKPEPDSAARKRAINLALMEFDAVQEAQAAEQQSSEDAAQPQKKSSWFQGFLQRLRLMGTHNPDRTAPTNAFNFPQNNLLISGLATCSLAVVGVLLFQQMPIHTSATFDEPLVQMPVTAEPELATAAAPEYSRREAEAPVRLARQIATQREAREK